jgi:hypothetical protein
MRKRSSATAVRSDAGVLRLVMLIRCKKRARAWWVATVLASLTLWRSLWSDGAC